jgi:hypothetical protein
MTGPRVDSVPNPAPSRSRGPNLGRWVRAAFLAFAVLEAFAATGSAQTVIVRNVPPDTAVEVALNGTLVGSATANISGDATVPFGQAPGTKPQMDANVYLDTCGPRRRVVVFDRSQNDVLPEGDCVRLEIPGVYVVRSISTLVVNASGPLPSMLLVQGPYDPDAPPKTWQPLPTGLFVFGSTGLTMIGDAGAYACGTVEGCNDDGSGFGFEGGVEYWLRPWLGAEVSFLKPADMKADGSGSTYRFDSTLETSILTISGKVGIPAGPIRFYGKAGANYHRALHTTNQTIDDTTVTVDEETGETQFFPGATQTLDYRTGGWGWNFGGGAEAWFKTRFALYGEVDFIFLKGENLDEGEGTLDDRVTMFVFGGRLRIF